MGKRFYKETMLSGPDQKAGKFSRTREGLPGRSIFAERDPVIDRSLENYFKTGLNPKALERLPRAAAAALALAIVLSSVYHPDILGAPEAKAAMKAKKSLDREPVEVKPEKKPTTKMEIPLKAKKEIREFAGKVEAEIPKAARMLTESKEVEVPGGQIDQVQAANNIAQGIQETVKVEVQATDPLAKTYDLPTAADIDSELTVIGAKVELQEDQAEQEILAGPKPTPEQQGLLAQAKEAMKKPFRAVAGLVSGKAEAAEFVLDSATAEKETEAEEGVKTITFKDTLLSAIIPTLEQMTGDHYELSEGLDPNMKINFEYKSDKPLTKADMPKIFEKLLSENDLSVKKEEARLVIVPMPDILKTLFNASKLMKEKADQDLVKSKEAQKKPTPETKTQVTEKKVRGVMFEKAPLKDVAQTFSELAGKSYILADEFDPETKIDFEFESEKPLSPEQFEKIFEMFLKKYNYRLNEEGDKLVISPQAVKEEVAKAEVKEAGKETKSVYDEFSWSEGKAAFSAKDTAAMEALGLTKAVGPESGLGFELIDSNNDQRPEAIQGVYQGKEAFKLQINAQDPVGEMIKEILPKTLQSGEPLGEKIVHDQLGIDGDYELKASWRGLVEISYGAFGPDKIPQTIVLDNNFQVTNVNERALNHHYNSQEVQSFDGITGFVEMIRKIQIIENFTKGKDALNYFDGNFASDQSIITFLNEVDSSQAHIQKVFEKRIDKITDIIFFAGVIRMKFPLKLDFKQIAKHLGNIKPSKVDNLLHKLVKKDRVGYHGDEAINIIAQLDEEEFKTNDRINHIFKAVDKDEQYRIFIESLDDETTVKIINGLDLKELNNFIERAVKGNPEYYARLFAQPRVNIDRLAQILPEISDKVIQKMMAEDSAFAARVLEINKDRYGKLAKFVERSEVSDLDQSFENLDDRAKAQVAAGYLEKLGKKAKSDSQEVGTGKPSGGELGSLQTMFYNEETGKIEDFFYKMMAPYQNKAVRFLVESGVPKKALAQALIDKNRMDFTRLPGILNNVENDGIAAMMNADQDFAARVLSLTYKGQDQKVFDLCNRIVKVGYGLDGLRKLLDYMGSSAEYDESDQASIIDDYINRAFKERGSAMQSGEPEEAKEKINQLTNIIEQTLFKGRELDNIFYGLTPQHQAQIMVLLAEQGDARSVLEEAKDSIDDPQKAAELEGYLQKYKYYK